MQSMLEISDVTVVLPLGCQEKWLNSQNQIQCQAISGRTVRHMDHMRRRLAAPQSIAELDWDTTPPPTTPADLAIPTPSPVSDKHQFSSFNDTLIESALFSKDRVTSQACIKLVTWSCC